MSYFCKELSGYCVCLGEFCMQLVLFPVFSVGFLGYLLFDYQLRLLFILLIGLFCVLYLKHFILDDKVEEHFIKKLIYTSYTIIIIIIIII